MQRGESQITMNMHCQRQKRRQVRHRRNTVNRWVVAAYTHRNAEGRWVVTVNTH